MQDLKEVLAEDELHIFYILLKDVQIQVRCGEKYGKTSQPILEHLKVTVPAPSFSLYI